MTIKQIHTIIEDRKTTFENELSKVVDSMQKDGLILEIQYSTVISHHSTIHYTALVIGREDEKKKYIELNNK